MNVFDWTSRRVLIVDGDDAVRNWIAQVFQSVGAGAVMAMASAGAALKQLDGPAWDVALVEVFLADVDGIEFTRLLREHERRRQTNGTPVILMATSATRPMLRLACHFGIHSFIRKPAAPEAILGRVAATILEPTRFMAERDYIGPDRRRRPAAAPFMGPERRQPLSEAERRLDIPPPPRLAVQAPPPIAAKPKIVATLSKRPPAQQPGQKKPNPGKPPSAAVNNAVSGHIQWLRTAGREGHLAELEGANLSGVDLHAVNLANAHLRGAILADANCDDAQLQGADLRNVDFSGASIAAGDLGVARLRHANLGLANLDGANLKGADLAGASLRAASLQGTLLESANLLQVDLRQTDLRAAIGLVQAQINRTRTDAGTKLPAGLRRPDTD